jgi:hypothetical protein
MIFIPSTFNLKIKASYLKMGGDAPEYVKRGSTSAGMTDGQFS